MGKNSILGRTGQVYEWLNFSSAPNLSFKGEIKNEKIEPHGAFFVFGVQNQRKYFSGCADTQGRHWEIKSENNCSPVSYYFVFDAE
jgi:WD40 repeat protein